MKLNDKALDSAASAYWDGMTTSPGVLRAMRNAITAYLDILKVQGLARYASARASSGQFETPGSWVASDDGSPRDFLCLIIKLEE